MGDRRVKCQIVYNSKKSQHGRVIRGVATGGDGSRACGIGCRPCLVHANGHAPPLKPLTRQGDGLPLWLTADAHDTARHGTESVWVWGIG